MPAADKRTAARVGSQKFGFVEGPVWVDALEVLLFSDMDFAGGNAKGPPSQIRRLRPPASFDVFVASSGSNGLALAGPGSVLAATHDTQSLSLFDVATGARTDLGVKFASKTFNSPNDLAVREDGVVYFSDPDYQLGSRSRQQTVTGVYRFALGNPPASMVSASSVDDTFTQPNGIALSPDQKTLYVSSGAAEVYKLSVAADGSVSGKTVFAKPGAGDGMTVDCAGNLYVTAGKVQVFAPSGDKLGEIAVAETPSNVAFGGRDHRTLYITAQTGLYAIALAVPGFPF